MRLRKSNHFDIFFCQLSFVGRESIAKLLIDKKADIHAIKDDGYTPLHSAADTGDSQNK